MEAKLLSQSCSILIPVRHSCCSSLRLSFSFVETSCERGEPSRRGGRSVMSRCLMPRHTLPLCQSDSPKEVRLPQRRARMLSRETLKRVRCVSIGMSAAWRARRKLRRG